MELAEIRRRCPNIGFQLWQENYPLSQGYPFLFPFSSLSLHALLYRYIRGTYKRKRVPVRN